MSIRPTIQPFYWYIVVLFLRNLFIFNVDFVKFLNKVTYTNNLHNKFSRIVITTENHYAHTQNIRVFVYFQLKHILLKKAYDHDDSYIFFRKLVSLNTKNGFKNKAVHIFYGALQYIYSYFDKFDLSLSKEYPTYITFFEFSKNFTQEFYKPDFLLKYIHNYLELIFLIKKIQPKKKLKKKKIVPKISISYIPKNTRSNMTLRVINSYINYTATNNSTIKLGNALLYLILAGKTSFLYKKKINMYNKLLEKKKFY